MNDLADEQIDRILDRILRNEDGYDYYAYTHHKHWWGTVEEMREFARAILKKANEK
jgi:hypothetical protein